MNFIIIGYGNMGRKHGTILKELGHTFEIADPYLGYPMKYPEGYAGALICTPPETHLELAGLCDGAGTPCFIEKPVLSDSRADRRAYRITVPTLVACNWRWGYLGKPETAVFSYSRPHWLDLIHFLDLYWERLCKPKGGWIKFDYLSNSLYLDNKGPFTIVNNPKIERIINGKEIDVGTMFYEQMKHFIDIVKGKVKSVNPFDVAVERTQYLIGLKNDNKIIRGLEARA